MRFTSGSSRCPGTGRAALVRMLRVWTDDAARLTAGRGALADVSQKLLGQFVESLESTVLAADNSEPGPDVGVGGTGSGPGSEVRAARETEVAPIDLLDTAGAPVAKRVLPVFAVVFALVLFVAVRRRRRRRRA